MTVSQQSLDVRVSKRILWFGSEAYSLPNITHTGTVTLEPDRRAAIRGFAVTTFVTLFVMSIVAAATPGFVSALAVLAGLGWIAFRLYRLTELLKLRLYQLNIETAAGSHRGLVSDDPMVVADLHERITDAMNNPHAEFQTTVTNFQVGDNFSIHGTNTVNKVNR